MVIWLIGVSGSGKSTIGSLLKARLDKKNIRSFLIDGDDVRKFFGGDLGYSILDRTANIKRVIYGAYVLSQNDIVTIICNISPFQELRTFARRKLKNYNEIYLHKNVEACIQSDVKNMYKKNFNKSHIVGIEIPFEPPVSCDLRIDVDSCGVEEALESLNVFLRKKYSSWPL